MQREIENGLNRRMRRELQVEPLILCLAQPAPSGTRAYQPKLDDEVKHQPRHKHYPNVNNQPKNPNQKNFKNQPSKNEHNQNKPIKESVENKEEVSSGRTRRRRSAVAS